MKPRRLVLAVALPAVALAAGVFAAMPGPQHHQQTSYGHEADAGPLLLQPAFQHRPAPRHHHAARHSQHKTHNSTKNGTNQATTLSTFANVDYASGGYGQYSSTALHSPWVQAVDINLNWRRLQLSPSSFDWAPLDSEATAWANAGKHIVLVVRATDDIGGGCAAGPGQYLAGFVITDLHNALGSIGTFCDKGFNSLVPDWFSSTFQSDFKTFVNALGAHVSAQPYYSSISYVRVGVGLGSEGWFLYPNQSGYNADKSWMETNWHYTPQAWANFQETMMASYHAAFPAPVQVIYPISEQDDLSPGVPVDVAVAEWATNLGDVGVGQQCLTPGGIKNYADFPTIDSWVRANHPNAYIQFQTCDPTATASEEQGIITAAEGYGAKSIEWYETTIVSPPSVSEMTSYQAWANNAFKG